MSATLFDPALAVPTAAPVASSPVASSPAASPSPSARQRRAGRVLGGIAVLFLAMDVAMKFAAPRAVVEGTIQAGWQAHHIPILAVIGAVCLVLYLVPRTAPLGAVLWTGYFGGAIATHLRLDEPLLTHTLFPAYVAALLWGSLYLRDPRVRAFADSVLRPAR